MSGELLNARRLAALLVTLIALVAAQPAAAQSDARTDTTVSVEELERLVATLESDIERARFIAELKAVIAAQKKVTPEEPALPERVGTRALGALADGLSEAAEAIVEAASFLTDAPKVYAWFETLVRDEASRGRLAEIFGKLAAVLASGWLVEWLVVLALRPLRRRIEQRKGDGAALRIVWAAAYHALTLLPIAAFAVTALAALGFVRPSSAARLVALAFVNANVIARVIAFLGHVAFAPRAPQFRPLALGDETAAYFDLWTRRLSGIAVYGYFFAEAALWLGLGRVGHAFFLKGLGLLLAILLGVLILQNRADVARALAGRLARPGEVSLRARLAPYWHVAALGYVGFATVVWLIQPDSGLGFVMRATLLTLVIFAIAVAVVALVQRILRRLFHVAPEAKARFPLLEARANRYLQVFNLAVPVVVYGFAALAAFQAWGLGSLDWLDTPLGRRIGASMLAILSAVVLSALIWEAANLALERYIGRTFGRGIDELRRAARVRTLMPMVQRVLMVILAAFVGLIVLSELGVNITPLLALSGAAGLAVGLGAQDTIKDFLAGMSVVLEDSIAIGDVVQVGDKSGLVEAMSIRTLRLRSFDGTVHTIPFSEFKTISNMTKDYAHAVFDVSVSYQADVDKVMEVLKHEGAALRADPEIGPLILDDLEIFGVERFADSAVIIRARFRTRPIQQWNVMRAFNRRIKLAFDRDGIEIPFPQRTVHIASPAPVTPLAPASGV